MLCDSIIIHIYIILLHNIFITLSSLYYTIYIIINHIKIIHSYYDCNHDRETNNINLAVTISSRNNVLKN